MADWQAFATAFLNKAAEDIDEATIRKQNYIDDFRADTEKNKTAFQKRRNAANQLFGIAKSSMDLGATPDMVQAAMDSGPTGLTDLRDKLQKLQSDLGRFWTKEEAALRYSSGLPSDFQSRNLTVDTMQDELYRLLGMSPPTTDSETSDDSLMSRLFVTDPVGQARQQLDKEPSGVEGYSVYDLASIASSNPYDITGAPINYQEQAIWTYDGTEYLRVNNHVQKSLKLDELYKEKKKTLAVLEDKYEVRPDGIKAVEEYLRSPENYQGADKPDIESYLDAKGYIQNAEDKGYSTWYNQRYDVYGESYLRHVPEAEPYIEYDENELITLGGEIQNDGSIILTKNTDPDPQRYTKTEEGKYRKASSSVSTNPEKEIIVEEKAIEYTPLELPEGVTTDLPIFIGDDGKYYIKKGDTYTSANEDMTKGIKELLSGKVEEPKVETPEVKEPIVLSSKVTSDQGYERFEAMQDQDKRSVRVKVKLDSNGDVASIIETYDSMGSKDVKYTEVPKDSPKWDYYMNKDQFKKYVSKFAPEKDNNITPLVKKPSTVTNNNEVIEEVDETSEVQEVDVSSMTTAEKVNYFNKNLSNPKKIKKVDKKTSAGMFVQYPEFTLDEWESMDPQDRYLIGLPETDARLSKNNRKILTFKKL